jgi:cytochrome c oxidase subunit 1
MSSAGATILGVGYVIPLIYFIWSMRYGRQASANPWGVVSLEWQVSSPPPEHNFATPPVVTSEPYEYPRPKESPGVA